MESNQLASLNGKVALVTGASRGLGRAIASSLTEAGAKVVVTDIAVTGEKKAAVQSPDLAVSHGQPPIEPVLSAGDRNLESAMDVTCMEQIEKTVCETEKRFGSIDILINNAAVMDQFALVEHQTLETWERDLDVNLSGAFRCIKAVWKGMRKKKWGRVINISSFTAESGSLGQPGYGSTKAGLQGLTRALALEGAQHQITVNTVLPGFIDTEALRSLDPEILKRIKSRIAMKRFAEPEEIANVVLFLASEASSYVTGASIPVTGGADLFVF